MPKDAELHEDVFLSYSRDDAGIGSKVSNFLESKGYSVFWDPEIRNSADWRIKLDTKLEGVKCVLVLWSKQSVTSEWVLEEADFGRSRQVLVTARLDDCKLPFGFRRLQVDDLTSWVGDSPPSGMVGVLARINELVSEKNTTQDRRAKDKKLRLEQKRTLTEHISVSNHDRDRDAVLNALIGQPHEVEESIHNGYSELTAAQHAALYMSNDRAPLAHYRSAAEHFLSALDIIGDAKAKIARDGRSVEYFLAMERANCLVFAEPGRGTQSEPIDEAIEIYKRLSRDKRYCNDVPVHFRLACALVRKTKTEGNLKQSIRALRKARAYATNNHNQNAGPDQLLLEGQWIHAELARQLGLCNYFISELPGITTRRKKKYFRDAIQETRDAIETTAPNQDPDQLFAFTILKSKGNLLYFLAQKVREGDGAPEVEDEIRRMIAELKAPESWDVTENQVCIIDDIAYAAATIGDWVTALDEAGRNVENFASLAVTHGLEHDEQAMEARAKEIQYFARTRLEAARDQN